MKVFTKLFPARVILILTILAGFGVASIGFSQDEAFEDFDVPPSEIENFDSLDNPDVDPPNPDSVSGLPEDRPSARPNRPSDRPSSRPSARSRESRSTPPARGRLGGRRRSGGSGSSNAMFGRNDNPNQPARDKKYVNLNPETAYGPEIIKSFDFPDVDILEITKHMQKLTGINLILDKDVKGKVSIVAPTPITVGDAWKAYLVALNMAGYSLVKTGAFYRIINSRDVRYTPTKIYTGEYIPNTENYMMKIISLKYVSASEIVKNFRPFMSRYGRIIDIKQTNTIIITDTGTNINRLMKLVQFVDVAGFEETLQIIKVKHTSAQEIAKLLDSILKEDTGRGRSRRRSSKNQPDGGPVISRIIAEPRTNSIIAMANDQGAKHLMGLIAKLDVQTVSKGSGKIQVYYLQHGDAENLAKTLTTLISGAVQQGRTANNSRRTSSRRSGSRFGSDNNAAQSEPIFNEEVKVTADKSTNSLVVTASPTDWLTVKDVIRKLDIPRDQVFVEGLVLETKVTKNREFGTSLFGAHGSGTAQRFGNNSANVLNLASPEGLAALSGGFFGFTLGETKTVDLGGQEVEIGGVNGILQALASDVNNEILATPQILATDNTEAVFSSGQTVPIIASQANNAAGGTVATAGNEEAKLELKITPQINKVTRFIKLKIDQKIESFDQTSEPLAATGGRAKSISQATTEVIVKDKDTIAMGGLLKDEVGNNISKVPLLGDIPVLGWLFKKKTKGVSKTNIIFFLTPTIISPYETTAKQNTIRKINEREKFFKKDPKNKKYETPSTEKARQLKKRLSKAIREGNAAPNPFQANNGIPSSIKSGVPNYREIAQEAKKKKESTTK